MYCPCPECTVSLLRIIVLVLTGSLSMSGLIVYLRARIQGKKDNSPRSDNGEDEAKFPISKEEHRRHVRAIERKRDAAMTALALAPDDRAEIMFDAEVTAYDDVLEFFREWEGREEDEEDLADAEEALKDYVAGEGISFLETCERMRKEGKL